MARTELGGLTIAILVTDGFEQVEMPEPRKALGDAGAITSDAGAITSDAEAITSDVEAITSDAGAITRIVSPKDVRSRARTSPEWGAEYPVDVTLDRAQPHGFDALLLPGGVLEEAVLDGNRVPGRKPDDNLALDREMMGLFSRAGRQEGQRRAS